MIALKQLLLAIILCSRSIAAAVDDLYDDGDLSPGPRVTESALDKRALIYYDRPFFKDFPAAVQCSDVRCYPDVTLVRLIKAGKGIHQRRDYFIVELSDKQYFTFYKKVELLNGKNETIHHFMNGYTPRSARPCTKLAEHCPTRGDDRPDCAPDEIYDPYTGICKKKPPGIGRPPFSKRAGTPSLIIPRGTLDFQKFPRGLGCKEKKFSPDLVVWMPHDDYDETFSQDGLTDAVRRGFSFTGHSNGAIAYLPVPVKKPSYILFNAVQTSTTPDQEHWIFTFVNAFPGSDSSKACDKCPHSHCHKVPLGQVEEKTSAGEDGGDNHVGDLDENHPPPAVKPVKRSQSLTETKESEEVQQGTERDHDIRYHPPPACYYMDTPSGRVLVCPPDDKDQA